MLKVDVLNPNQLHKKAMRLMGNNFEITVVCKNADFANEAIEKAVEEIQRIEKLLTTFSNTSEVFFINENAGISPVKVCKEVIDIIIRANKISKITQGAFDITYGSVDKKLWNFDQKMTSIPSPAVAKAMVRLINYKNIEVNEKEETVFLKEKGMRIGFGGIGKGYAAEKAKEVLKSKGVENGIVNASGDLTTWGTQPNGKPWTIGIAHPDSTNLPFSYMNISNMAVATSGNYEKFVLINNKKYSHTINPKTGLPITGIKSVTIICKNAEIADAMATPITIMGAKVGLNLVNQLNGIECIIIDDNNKVFTSKNINII